MRTKHIYMLLMIMVACPSPKIKPDAKECMRQINAHKDNAIRRINQIRDWGLKNRGCTT